LTLMGPSESVFPFFGFLLVHEAEAMSISR